MSLVNRVASIVCRASRHPPRGAVSTMFAGMGPGVAIRRKRTHDAFLLWQRLLGLVGEGSCERGKCGCGGAA